jgi:hypothetical protein
MGQQPDNQRGRRDRRFDRLRHFQLLIVVSTRLRWRAKIHARSWRSKFAANPANVTKSRAAHALQEALPSTLEQGKSLVLKIVLVCCTYVADLKDGFTQSGHVDQRQE